jgi:Reverse transcriptase (RNA-dependent DNA polymerase)
MWVNNAKNKPVSALTCELLLFDELLDVFFHFTYWRSFISIRPISNLPVLAKLLERLVTKQLLAYLKMHCLLPRLLSAYRAAHSTETKITSDILSALDKGDLVALMLLDLSTTFDTVDHNILLQRMRVSYGISGVALK